MKPVYYLIIAWLSIYIVYILNIFQFVMFLLFAKEISLFITISTFSAYVLSVQIEKILEFYKIDSDNLEKLL